MKYFPLTKEHNNSENNVLYSLFISQVSHFSNKGVKDFFPSNIPPNIYKRTVWIKTENPPRTIFTSLVTSTPI